MKRTRTILVLGATLAMTLTGMAYALTVDPTGGPPGSRYQVQVPCSSAPRVQVRDIGRPQATLPWLGGVESSPGTWTFDIEAGSLDQMVYSACGGQNDRFRYDVDNPQLFPGPTAIVEIVPRPDVEYTSVVGTDCPAGTTASVAINGPGGYSYAQTAAIDGYGNWEVPIPATAPHSDLTVDASCGSVHYATLVMPFGPRDSGPGATDPPGTATTSMSPASTLATNPSAASPVPADPLYAG